MVTAQEKERAQFTEEETSTLAAELWDAVTFLRMLKVYVEDHADRFHDDLLVLNTIITDTRICLEHVIPEIDRIAETLSEGRMEEKAGGAA